MDKQSPLSDSERKAPFQWSPQVLMMLAVTLLMLTLPLALLSVAIIQAFQPASSEVIVESPAPDELRQSLERAAESLKPTELGSENRVKVFGVDHVVKVAGYFAVTAVKVGEGRYWVSLPKEQRATFSAALTHGGKPETIPAAVSAPELLEVVIEPTPTTP